MWQCDQELCCSIMFNMNVELLADYISDSAILTVSPSYSSVGSIELVVGLR